MFWWIIGIGVIASTMRTRSGFRGLHEWLSGTRVVQLPWRPRSALVNFPLVKSEPGFMSHWAIAYLEIKKGLAEIVLTGENMETLRSDLQKNFLPFAILQGGDEQSELPLQKGKIAIGGKATIYVCYNKTCQLPVHEVSEALGQLET
jgi:uncharacterized protein YyaL (SSP411 family)